LSILFFALKPIVKKLLSIEIVIFHTFAISEAYSEKNLSKEIASNKLEKGPLRDYETGSGEGDFYKEFAFFPSFSLRFFGKYSEFRKLMNKS
jgi:hypothetical protein